MITKIKNCWVITPDFSNFLKSDLFINGGKIFKISNDDIEHDKEIDAKNAYVIPGFIDIHTHGSFGHSYFDSENFAPALEWTCSKGITTVIPTISSYPIEKVISYAKNVLSQSKNSRGASIRGIHFEGPFINNNKKGSMSIALEDMCSIEMFETIVASAEYLPVTMTIAPEVKNATEVIKYATENGIRMSLGHSMATYEEAIKGIEAGATGATHTFNAMRSYEHRETGILGAVMTEPSVFCEVICDLVHLALPTIKIIRAAKGVDRMILISDSGAITGMSDGEYFINGQRRIVKDGVCRIPAGNIAGSCFNMVDGGKNLIKAGFSLAEVAKMSSHNPAKAMNIYSEVGSVEEGKIADLLLVTPELDVQTVIKDGEAFTL